MTRLHTKALVTLLSLAIVIGLMPAFAFAKTGEEAMGEEPVATEAAESAQSVDDGVPAKSTTGTALAPESEPTSDSELAPEAEPAPEIDLAPELEPGCEEKTDCAPLLGVQVEETDSVLQVQATTNDYARSAYIGYIKEAARSSMFNTAQYCFADVFGDATDEALVVYKSPQGSGSYLQIFTYANGSVRRLLHTGLYGDIEYTFCKSRDSFVMHLGGHGGEMYSYFQISGGAYVQKAYRSHQSTSYGGRTDTPWGYYTPSGSISYSEFSQLTSGLFSGSTVPVSGSGYWSSMGANDWVRDPVTGFYDVRGNHWAAAVIERASKLGLINGYANGNFGPDDPISRGQAAVVLWNLAGRPAAGAGARSFWDVGTGDYFYQAVRWASGAGVVSGYGNGGFGPNDSVTREQLAVMLAGCARYATGRQVVGSAADYASMTDGWKVSSWAVPAVGWCFRNGILSGADGRVNPQGNATRAETAKMVVVLHDLLA